MEQSMKRIFLIVLDSCGVGYEPDADKFGDVGADTLRRCAHTGAKLQNRAHKMKGSVLL